MRTVVVGFALVALTGLTGLAGAQPKEYPSAEGKYTVRFPGAPKRSAQNTKSAVGDLTVNLAVYANADGSAYMASHTDFPAAATKAENRTTLFEGLRDGAKGRDGKIAGDEKELKVGAEELPGREFTIEKGKQRIRYRIVLRDNRVYQIAAIGTEAFVTGKDANAFFDSFQITK